MKTPAQTNRERGFFATILMVAILGIILIFVAANAKRLHQLDQELRLVEQRQISRHHPPAPTTNCIPAKGRPDLPAATSP